MRGGLAAEVEVLQVRLGLGDARNEHEQRPDERLRARLWRAHAVDCRQEPAAQGSARQTDGESAHVLEEERLAVLQRDRRVHEREVAQHVVRVRAD